jgi:hypothetical protein
LSGLARAVYVAERAGVRRLDGRVKHAVHWNRIMHAFSRNVECRDLWAVGVFSLMTSRQHGATLIATDALPNAVVPQVDAAVNAVIVQGGPDPVREVNGEVASIASA